MTSLDGSLNRPANHRWTLPLAAVAAAGFFTLSWFLLNHGRLNADEGFYLLASRVVRQGFRPYQDFGFTQPPLLAYADIPWLEVFGYTLGAQRLAGLAWTFVALGSGAIWLKRHHSLGTAAIFLVVLLGSPGWLAFCAKGKTYAFGGMWVLFGIMALVADGRIWLRWLVFLSAAGFAIGTRLPLAAFFVPAGIYLLIVTPGWKQRGCALGGTLLFAALELVWISAGSWDNFLFWTVQYHRLSAFDNSIQTRLIDSLRLAPGVWLLTTWATFLVVRARAWKLFFALFCCWTSFAVNLSTSATYAEYLVPFIPAAVFVSVPIITRNAERMSRWLWAGLVLILLGSGWNLPPEYSKDILVHAKEAEAFLKDHVPRGSQVAASVPEVAVAAGLRVPLPMAMGKFGLTEDFTEGVAAKRLLLSPATLLEIIQDRQTRAIVLSTFDNWNFRWSVPSYKKISDRSEEIMWSTIGLHYDLAYKNDYYVILLRRTP